MKITLLVACQDVNLAEMPHYFVAPAFDVNVGNAVRQLGTFDLGQSYALQTLCRSGDVVIDVGANVGGFTVPLAERVGPDGEVHAFEPFRKAGRWYVVEIILDTLTWAHVKNHPIQNSAYGFCMFFGGLHSRNIWTENASIKASKGY